MDRHSEIAEHAYLIWERKGCPQGKALECWLEAETEVMAAEKVRQHMRKTAATRPAHH
jgi:hypothetical protein